MLYLGHIGLWMSLIFLRMMVKGGDVKLFDALVISCMMAIFSSLAHAFVFGS